MKPCILCKRTIDIISQENNFKLTIIHSKKSSELPKENINKYDKLAKAILKFEQQKKNSD